MSSRRSFIKKSIPLGILALSPEASLKAIHEDLSNDKAQFERPKVLFFDVNETLLDLEPLKASIVKILNNRTDLGTLWFTTMLQYSLVVTTSNQYFDFGAIGIAALQMLAMNNNIALTNEEAKAAVKPILSLQPHPEVKEALIMLRNDDYKLVTFTNSSNFAIEQQLHNSGLTSFFDASISVEDFGKFKPDTAVYHWASRKMKVENKDCLLIAAHEWDIAGAIWAGWQGAFIARKGQQLFPLAPKPLFDKPDLLQVAHSLIALK